MVDTGDAAPGLGLKDCAACLFLPRMVSSHRGVELRQLSFLNYFNQRGDPGVSRSQTGSP